MIHPDPDPDTPIPIGPTPKGQARLLLKQCVVFIVRQEATEIVVAIFLVAIPLLTELLRVFTLKPETPSRLNFSHLQSVAFIFHCISADCHCLSPHLLDNPTLSHAIYNVNTKNKKIITNREGAGSLPGRSSGQASAGEMLPGSFTRTIPRVIVNREARTPNVPRGAERPEELTRTI